MDNNLYTLIKEYESLNSEKRKSNKDIENTKSKYLNQLKDCILNNNGKIKISDEDLSDNDYNNMLIKDINDLNDIIYERSGNNNINHNNKIKRKKKSILDLFF